MKLRTFVILASLVSVNAFAEGNIKIYDASKMFGFGAITKKGKLVIDNGEPIMKKTPREAVLLAENFKKIQKYFFEYHNRNSWDDKGSDIEATINIRGILSLLGFNENASWFSAANEDMSNIDPVMAERMKLIDKRFLFGKGSRNGLDGFEEALDVVAHEYTHAVIESTSNLKYEGQSGALNEHLADVFAVIINNKYNKLENPYLIGATIIRGSNRGKSLRDMEFPEKGLSKQPGHMLDLNTDKYKIYVNDCKPSPRNDFCGVHVLSGIPNKMAVHVLKNLTNEEATELFYKVMTERLTRNSQFGDYKNALLEECKSISAKTCEVVNEGLAKVGL